MQRVAVITGASSGLGWALARELAREGYALGLTARREERLRELAALIQEGGGRAAYAAADAGDRTATLAAISSLVTALGAVDLMVANAGVGLSESILAPNHEDYETMVRVNLLGPFYAFEAVVPAMLARGSGQLVGISSLAAYISAPGTGQYSATKAGLSIWLDSLRLELQPKGISVTTIQPGFVETPMTAQNDCAMPGLMSAERAARLMARAIRKRKKVYNFPWHIGVAARLARHLPDWMRRRLS